MRWCGMSCECIHIYPTTNYNYILRRCICQKPNANSMEFEKKKNIWSQTGYGHVFEDEINSLAIPFHKTTNEGLTKYVWRSSLTELTERLITRKSFFKALNKIQLFNVKLWIKLSLRSLTQPWNTLCVLCTVYCVLCAVFIRPCRCCALYIWIVNDVRLAQV